MGTYGIVNEILARLVLYPSSLPIHQSACHLLAKLAQSSPHHHHLLHFPHSHGLNFLGENRKVLIGSKAYDVITKSMQNHMYDADAQLYACWALVEIAAEDGTGRRFLIFMV